MQRSALDLLACPIDKDYPLELYELAVRGDEISDGLLYCTKCGRYYPIVEEIPIMLPDELRKVKDDLEFLKKWQEKLPDKVIKQGNPWHL